MPRQSLSRQLNYRTMPDKPSLTAPQAVPSFYQPGQHSPQQSVGYLMRKVLGSILSQADTRLAMHDVTYVQYLPLYKLLHCDHADATVATLARELEVDAGAMTRALDRLQAKGLVERERSTADRRVVHLTLTPAGRTVAEQVPGVLADVLNGHLRGFSKPEWQQLLQLLQRMLANGDALRPGAATQAAPAAAPVPATHG